MLPILVQFFCCINIKIIYIYLSATTQSPSYADKTTTNVNLPLSIDPVLAVVTNFTVQQVSNWQWTLDCNLNCDCLRQEDTWGMISLRR